VAEYTKVNLNADVEDQAPSFGLEGIEARFASQPLGLQKCGLSFQRIAPNTRVPFGHRQNQQEEIYVVVGGSGRAKLDDEIIDVAQWDAIRVSPETMRAFEGGPDGAEVLAYGAPRTAEETAGTDGEMTPGWWDD
jgi:hypothetical protein